MIGRLAGIILHRAMDQVLIDVRGVGYIVHVSSRTAAALPPVGQATALYTELLVREDLLQLFGFTTLQEKEWHRLLVSVQGVGAKAALAILGTLGPDALGRAIAMGDWASVRAAPGIGPKLAQRVVLELRGKAPSVMSMGGALSVDLAAADEVIEATPGPRKSTAAPPPSATVEAMSALANLGYSPTDAAAAVAEASANPEAIDTPRLIRAALRLLAPKN
jgi:Holliday junction DNA helicase RuvA